MVAWGLYLLLRWLRGTRPDLAIGAPISVAVGMRVLAAVGVSSTGVASTLRGGDEVGFLFGAQPDQPYPLPWARSGPTRSPSDLYEFIFAGQMRVLDSPDLVLRITQAGIAVAGLVLLATAVYELAGPRAAVIAAWVLAFEPSNIFFSTLLHKEPNLLLAGGLVAFGGASMWKSARLQYLWPITLGCLVAVATRPYAGWFLIAAGAAITLHVGIRARTEGARSLTLVALVVLLGAISAPTVWEASTHKSLQTEPPVIPERERIRQLQPQPREGGLLDPGGDHRQSAEAHRRRDDPPLPVAARQYQPAARPARHASSPSPASGCSPSSSGVPAATSWIGRDRWSTSASSR